MYPTPVGLMFAAKLVVSCLSPCLFNIIWWRCVFGGTCIRPWYSLHYGPWVVVLLLHGLYVQTLFSVLATCFCNETLFFNALLSASYVLASPAYLYVHTSTLLRLLAHHHLCCVDVYCVYTIKKLCYVHFLCLSFLLFLLCWHCYTIFYKMIYVLTPFVFLMFPRWHFLVFTYDGTSCIP